MTHREGSARRASSAQHNMGRFKRGEPNPGVKFQPGIAPNPKGSSALARERAARRRRVEASETATDGRIDESLLSPAILRARDVLTREPAPVRAEPESRASVTRTPPPPKPIVFEPSTDTPLDKTDRPAGEVAGFDPDYEDVNDIIKSDETLRDVLEEARKNRSG